MQTSYFKTNQFYQELTQFLDDLNHYEINFYTKEELKKFKPSLEVEEIEDAVYQEDLSDVTDLLKQIMDQKK